MGDFSSDLMLTHNERMLIEHMFQQQQIARVELAKLTGMTSATVTRTIAAMGKHGLFNQDSTRHSRRGQPRRMLSLIPDRYHSAGINFNFTDITASLVNFGGQVVTTRSSSFAKGDLDSLMQISWELVEEMLKEQVVDLENFLGLGLSVPGNFGITRLKIQAHTFFSNLRDVDKVRKMAAKLPVPLYIENEGTATAIGEYYFGNFKSVNPLVLVHIGHGIGGGAIINGSPYYGHRGNACLVGSMFPYDKPRPSGADLLDYLRSKDIVIKDYAELEDSKIVNSAALRHWLNRAGEQLGKCITVISGMFNPEVIVIGGMLPSSINKALVENIIARERPSPSRGLSPAPVMCSSLGPIGSSVGAACIPLIANFFAEGKALKPLPKDIPSKLLYGL